jgi:hypothetical protein
VKIAGKIGSLRNILVSSPSSWSLAQRQEYFDWATDVVDHARRIDGRLERMFDRLYRQRPES